MMAHALEMRSTINRIYYSHGHAGIQFYMYVGLLWLYSLLWNIPPLLGWGRYTTDGTGQTCSVNYRSDTWSDRSYMLSMFIGGFLTPLVILIACYLHIWFILRRSNQHVRQIREGLSPEALLNFPSPRKEEFQLLKLSIIVVSAFCLAWMPFAIVSLIGVFGREDLIGPYLLFAPRMFAKISPVYNPIIYSRGHPQVRKFIRNTFRNQIQSLITLSTSFETRNSAERRLSIRLNTRSKSI